MDRYTCTAISAPRPSARQTLAARAENIALVCCAVGYAVHHYAHLTQSALALLH